MYTSQSLARFIDREFVPMWILESLQFLPKTAKLSWRKQQNDFFLPEILNSLVQAAVQIHFGFPAEVQFGPADVGPSSLGIVFHLADVDHLAMSSHQIFDDRSELCLVTKLLVPRAPRDGNSTHH